MMLASVRLTATPAETAVTTVTLNSQADQIEAASAGAGQCQRG